MDPSSSIPGAGTRPDPIATAPPESHLERPSFRAALAEPSAELRFADLLDIVNPLQHIPVVSSIYRAITGDEISGPARVLGRTLFGGPIGMVAGIIDAIATQVNGADMGESAIAALFGTEEEAGVMVAEAGEDEAEPDALPSPVLAAAQVEQLPVPDSDGDAHFTGDAALAALRADLRGAAPVPAALLPPEAPDRPLRRKVATIDQQPPGPPLSPSPFTAQMLEGLDKYRALAVTRSADRPADYRPVDDTL